VSWGLLRELGISPPDSIEQVTRKFIPALANSSWKTGTSSPCLLPWENYVDALGGPELRLSRRFPPRLRQPVLEKSLAPDRFWVHYSAYLLATDLLSASGVGRK
jgi:hypothetical protein